MKRLFFFVLFFVALGWNGPVRAADTNVRAVQTKLKQDGFYFGDPTGVYDNETAAAVTRYQIRNGLPISGRLDAGDGPLARGRAVHEGCARVFDGFRHLAPAAQW